MSYRSGGSRSRGERGARSSSARARDDYGNGNGNGNGNDYDDRGYGSSRGYGGARPSGRVWDDEPEGSGWAGQRSGRAERQAAGTSSRALVIILSGLLTVIVLAVIGVLVLPGKISHPSVAVSDSPFATFTPGPTPTIADHFKAFSSDRSKYAITYPDAWNATSDERTTQGQYDYIDTFALQNAPSRLLIEQAGAFSTYTDQQMIAAEVTNATQNGVTFTKSDSPSPTQQVGGATWTRQDYAVNANGNPVHMVFLACHHGGRGYVVVLVSSAGEFSNDDQAVFEPMLSGFLFL